MESTDVIPPHSQLTSAQKIAFPPRPCKSALVRRVSFYLGVSGENAVIKACGDRKNVACAKCQVSRAPLRVTALTLGIVVNRNVCASSRTAGMLTPQSDCPPAKYLSFPRVTLLETYDLQNTIKWFEIIKRGEFSLAGIKKVPGLF